MWWLLWCFFVPVSGETFIQREVHNVALDSTYDVMHVVRNIHQCYGICVAYATCSVFNYDFFTRVCQLFSQASTGSLIYKKNSVYEELQQDAQSLGSSACNRRMCKEDDLCVQAANSESLCIPRGADCGDPIIVAGSRSTYFSTRFPSVATYMCKSGYNYVSGSNSSTCQTSGLWSDPELICEALVVCDVPPDLSNANLTYSGLDVYSVAEYTCITDYKFFGSNQQITCEVSGFWNGPNGTCGRIAFYNPSIPVSIPLPAQVAVGWKVEMIGVPLDEERSTFDLKYATDYIAIQVDARFQFTSYVDKVLRNSFTEDGWGTEYVDQPYFPFEVGAQFNLTLVVTTAGFDIFVNEVYFVNYSHVVNPGFVNAVNLERGVDMQSVKLFYQET